MEHTTASFEVPELEKTLAKRKKRYVNYKEGMALYSMGRDSFRKLAKDAHALLRIKKEGDYRFGYSGRLSGTASQEQLNQDILT